MAGRISPRKRSRIKPDSHGQPQSAQEQQRNPDVIKTSTSSIYPSTARERLEDEISEDLNIQLNENMNMETSQIDLTGESEDDGGNTEQGTKSLNATAQKPMAELDVTKVPNTPDSPGPWWRTLLPSSSWKVNSSGSTWLPNANPNRFFKLPMATNVEEDPVKSRNKSTSATMRGRKELPKRATIKDGKVKRPSLRGAVVLMRNRLTAKKALKNLEEDFFANSSRASKKSKKHTVATLLKAVMKEKPYPLTPKSIRALASVLKEAGYKSASAYIAEAKITHIEAGHEWTPLLERNIKLCKTAVSRGVGPRKKAPEVQEDAWALHDLLPDDHSPKTKVAWATHLFAMAVHWMMRELEVAALTADLIQFSKTDRSVMVTWEVSKTDPAAAGVKRVLKCVCEGDCDLRCPYEVMLFLVTKAKERRTHPCYLALDDQGFTVSKAQVVASWQFLYGPTITGHSARRSGALQYIRKGWSVAQVAFLGRWKSNIILEYAQEALQTMAVNVGCKFGDSEAKIKLKNEMETVKILQSSIPAGQEIQQALIEDLKKEIKSVKSGRRMDRVRIRKEVKSLETRMANNQKYLPPVVVSQRVQVAHFNCRALIVSPACMWKTLCGWQYYNSNYLFAEDAGSMVTCQKCVGLAQSKEVMGAKPHS